MNKSIREEFNNQTTETEETLVVWERLYPDVIIPEYAKPNDAGMDIHVHLRADDTVKSYDAVNPPEVLVVGECEGVPELRIPRHTRVILPTGLRAALKPGYEIQVRPRSSAIKSALRIPNAPGTVDAGYRGEIGILIENTGPVPVTVKHGARLAQLIVAPVLRAKTATLPFGETLEHHFSETARGSGAFGSTGGLAGVAREKIVDNDLRQLDALGVVTRMLEYPSIVVRFLVTEKAVLMWNRIRESPTVTPEDASAFVTELNLVWDNTGLTLVSRN